MKRHILIGIVAVAVLIGGSVAGIPSLAAADDYDSTLTLENKNWDGDWKPILGDNISATLRYNSSGEKFNFRLTAEGLTGGNYSLIYYADYNGDRFGHWGGNNPGKVIGGGWSAAQLADGVTDSIDLGMNLPCSPDANMAEHSYCGEPDNYTNCHGAKIWLIPTSALSGGSTLPVTAWPPDNNWLFETDLITYNDTGITGGSEVALTTTIPEEEICVSVTPNAFDFGEMQRGDPKGQMNILSVTNCGDVPITVTALVSGNLYTGGNLDISHGAGWAEIANWSTTLAVGESKSISLKLTVPIGFPAGTATGSLTFVAAPQTQ